MSDQELPSVELISLNESQLEVFGDVSENDIEFGNSSVRQIVTETYEEVIKVYPIYILDNPSIEDQYCAVKDALAYQEWLQKTGYDPKNSVYVPNPFNEQNKRNSFRIYYLIYPEKMHGHTNNMSKVPVFWEDLDNNSDLNEFFKYCFQNDIFYVGRGLKSRLINLIQDCPNITSYVTNITQNLSRFVKSDELRQQYGVVYGSYILYQSIKLDMAQRQYSIRRAVVSE